MLVALLFGVYIPELFPTEVRLRASGICNTFGRGATIVTPFLVVNCSTAYGVTGVLSLMIGLLLVLIVTVAALGIEPVGPQPGRTEARRHAAAGVLKEAS